MAIEVVELEGLGYLKLITEGNFENKNKEPRLNVVQ